MINPPEAKVLERFMKYVAVQSNGCWLWTGAMRGNYGVFAYKRVSKGAHRLIATWTYGEPAPGLVADHIICSTPACVNPKHLTFTTSRINNLRAGSNCLAAVNVRKTHCFKGHELTPDNVYASTSLTGRRCKECHRAWKRDRYYRLGENTPAYAKQRKSLGEKLVVNS